MYERPELNRVGEAKDVILGAIATGNDIDTLWIAGNQEFADDGDDLEAVVPKV
jgi:hypothetical protein